MDLNILNSGTPASKNWLTPVCGTLTCDEVIVIQNPQSKNAFNMYSLAALTLLPPEFTNPCNAIGVDNPDINLITNTYTAPRDCSISVDFQMLVFYSGLGATLSVDLVFTVNGLLTYLRTGLTVPSGAANQRFSMNCGGILKLNEGDVVGLNITTFEDVPTSRYTRASYSGTIL